MSANAVIVVDSSDEEEATPVVGGGRNAPLQFSSSDSDSDVRPSQAKKPRVAPPVTTKFSFSPATDKAASSRNSSNDDMESTDELEDSDEPKKPEPVAPAKKNMKQKRKPSVDQSDASEHSDEDDADDAMPRRFSRRDGRMFSDALSFSELQAQQRELERLQAQAHRKTSPRKTKPPARNITRQPAMKRKVSDTNLKDHGTPHSKSAVLKKTASPSPFDFDFPAASDDSSSSSSVDEDRTSLTGGARAKPMSLRDVVAQERELARLRKKDGDRNGASPNKTKTKKGAQKSLFSFGNPHANDVIDGTTWSTSESSGDETGDDIDGHEPEPKRSPRPELLSEASSLSVEFQEESDDEYMPSEPKQTVEPPKQEVSSSVSETKTGGGNKTSKKKVPLKKSSKAASKKRHSASQRSSSKSRTQTPSQMQASTIPLPEQRDASTTVMPTIMWRNVCVEVAPPSVLSVDAGVTLPFHSECDQPLLAYDKDGDLRSKCKILPQFGKPMQFMTSELISDTTEQVVTQEDMDNRVADIIQRELPRLRACHLKKTAAVIAEGRAKTKAYLEAHETQRRLPTLNWKHLGKVPALDKSLLNQMKQEKVTQSASLGYTNVWGETIAVKERLFAGVNVNQLPAIRPLSSSTAFIGLKANFRVEDDPIMRYKPYFDDDDDGGDIGVEWYDAIGAKESRMSSGLDGEVNEYLLRLVLRECGTSEQVFAALKKVPGFAQAYSDYSEIKKLDESVRLAARRIKEAKELIAKKSAQFPLAKVATLEPLLAGQNSSKGTLAERFASPPTYFDSNLARCHANRGYGLGLRPTKDYKELLVTYRDMFCRMCYVYHCVEHGIQHPLPSHRVDPTNPPLLLSPVALAAAEDQDDADSSDKTPESKSPAGSTPLDNSSVSTDENNKLDDFHGHSDGVHTDEDVAASRGSSETCYDTAEDDASATGTAHETRRSSRSATRISTLASRSLKKQVARPSRRKSSQTHRVKYPKVVDASEYLDDSHHAWVKAAVKKSLSADEKCSGECSKAATAEVSDETTREVVKVLSDTELVLLRKLHTIIGDNPCLIFGMVKSTTCKEVAAFLESERETKPIRTSSMDDMVLSPDAHSKNNGRKRNRTHTSRNSNNRILLNRTRNNRMKEKGTNHEYEPCDHSGVCNTMECSCMSRDHTCGKACSCPRDCPNRFPGCRCSLGNCRTKACPCFVAARECDPDLCFTCGASEVPALIFDEKRRNMSALDLGICCNVNILRGLHKKVGVAYSTTHGWGAFALEPIKRGEFIYEYHGALLSQDEAERRGSIYDKMTISFLFDADDDTVVDAIRIGNKSKFANHSAVGQKCKGKVLTVGGEHRISIWAQQDIEKGEELFFNYGYHGETAPDWSQIRIKGSTRHNPKKKEVKKDEH